MRSEQIIASLYLILEPKLGPTEARKTVSAVIFNIIGRLQDEGHSINEENLYDGLKTIAEDFEKASKSAA
jgi:hypothetical protein